jgi:hypothetical protein
MSFSFDIGDSDDDNADRDYDDDDSNEGGTSSNSNLQNQNDHQEEEIGTEIDDVDDDVAFLNDLQKAKRSKLGMDIKPILLSSSDPQIQESIQNSQNEFLMAMEQAKQDLSKSKDELGGSIDGAIDLLKIKWDEEDLQYKLELELELEKEEKIRKTTFSSSSTSSDDDDENSPKEDYFHEKDSFQ